MKKLLVKIVTAAMMMTLPIFLTSCGKSNSFKLEKEGDVEFMLELTTQENVQATLEQTVSILRARLDKAGYEFNIDKHDSKPLIVVVGHELTDNERLQQMRKMLVSSGMLEFWETYDSQDLYADMVALSQEYDDLLLGKLLQGTFYQGTASVGYASPSDTAAVNTIIHSEQARRMLPQDLRLLWGAKPFVFDSYYGRADRQEKIELYAIRTVYSGKPYVDGRVVTSAKVEKGYDDQPVISIEMDASGARIWANMTRKNVGHNIAMVIDGEVLSAPRVNSEITGGRSQITGNFTLDELKQLAASIDAKPLPVPVRIIAERNFLPSH